MLTFAILVLALALIPPLEARFGPGARRRPITANLLLVPVVLATSGLLAVFDATSLALVDDHGIGLIPWLGLDGAAAWVVALAGLDAAGYAGHRLRHGVPLLWRFHRTHHTDLEVDVTTTLRHHPFDVVGIVTVGATGLLVLGCRPVHLAGFGVLSTMFGLFDHLRFQLPQRLERGLGLVLQTPGLHRVHHSPTRVETDSNFGLVLTVWDRLFGTFRPVGERGPVGLDTLDLAQRQSVRAMLLEPWRPLVRAQRSHGQPADLASASG